jgi:class 3 adenylate cyclase
VERSSFDREAGEARHESGRLRVRAVMFVDISGSSRLYTTLGDEAAVRRVRGRLRLLSRVAGENAGRTVKETGDGLLCDFEDPDRALIAAEAMQTAMAEQQDAAEPRLDIHVGCHFGPVIESAGDVFGDTVNVAARVAAVARAGQIIATLEIVEQLTPVMRLKTRPLDAVSVKGRSQPVAVFEYLWGRIGHADVTIPAVPATKAPRSRLRVVWSDREVWLDRSGTPTIALGRSAECEVMVSDRAASRYHATIEVRGDRFVLVDHSSNGTFVSPTGAEEIRLRQEEMILPPRGRIGLGSAISAEGVTIVEFSHEA